jgi:hypothetical protein
MFMDPVCQVLGVKRAEFLAALAASVNEACRFSGHSSVRSMLIAPGAVAAFPLLWKTPAVRAPFRVTRLFVFDAYLQKVD